MTKPLVFLHGWGQSSQIWYQQQQAFPQAYFLNLPGHGGQDDSDSWLKTLAKQLPKEPCTLIGWSLGGMLAMQLALRCNELVHSLVLVNTTPKFRQSHTWQYGCNESTFHGFESGIQSQSAKTMSRFFALMFYGESMPRDTYQSIAKEAINRHNLPSSQAMIHGLQLLSDLDLRENIINIQQPSLIIHGESDAIIDVKSSDYLAEHIPHATLHHIKNTGHAPFLSHSNLFNSLLESWCQTI